MSDRGMKKWAPFSSLIEHNKEVIDVKVQKSKIKKPHISVDVANKIEYILNNYDNSCVKVDYFSDGAINQISGVINKIILLTNSIIIENKTILVKNIIDIN